MNITQKEFVFEDLFADLHNDNNVIWSENKSALSALFEKLTSFDSIDMFYKNLPQLSTFTEVSSYDV